MDDIDKKYYLPHKLDSESLKQTRDRIDDAIIKERMDWLANRDIPKQQKFEF